jgi:hypothetical protein
MSTPSRRMNRRTLADERTVRRWHWLAGLAVLPVVVLMLLPTPTHATHTGSCIRAWFDGSPVLGVRSFQPLQLDPENCLDSTHVVGTIEPIDTSGTNIGVNVQFSSAAPIDTVQLVSVDNGPGCKLRSMSPPDFTVFRGQLARSLGFSYPRNSGIPNFISISSVNLGLRDAYGATAGLNPVHYCPAPGNTQGNN